MIIICAEYSSVHLKLTCVAPGKHSYFSNPPAPVLLRGHRIDRGESSGAPLTRPDLQTTGQIRKRLLSYKILVWKWSNQINFIKQQANILSSALISEAEKNE